MSDDLDWIGQPSDNSVADVVRRARGLPPGAPVAAHLIREVRRWSMGEARRWSRARRLRLPMPVPNAAGKEDDAVRGAIEAVIGGPELACLLWLLLSLPDVGAALVEGALAALAALPRHEAAPLRSYAAGKAGRGPWPPRWGKVSPRSYVGGRLVPSRSPADLGPHPFHVAAVNASSPAQVGEWLDRLDVSDAARLGVLRDMRTVGSAVCAALPLPLWLPEPGPPRGIWPPAPPPPAAVVSAREDVSTVPPGAGR